MTIDVEITSGGADGVERLISTLDRLDATMEKLGSNSGLDRLTAQMAEMQQVIATGFANLAALSEKSISEMGARQARAIEEAGSQAVNAMEKNAIRMKTADAATWGQIQRGSAANVTRAFNQLAQGVPVETVRLRMGEMATTTAQSLDGQLEKLRQFQENAKSLFLTAYKPMAGATEAQMAEAYAMNAEVDAARAAKKAALYEKELAGEALFNRTQAEMAAARVAAQVLDYAREEQLAVEWEAMLAAVREKELAGEALFNRTQAKLQAERLAAIEAAAAREASVAAAAADRQRVLNANYLTSSPSSQVHTATQAQTYASLGGDASARYGSAAAGANALRDAQARLAASGGEVTRSHGPMNEALRQAEGAFRGAAHQAGIYGFHHGQLIALLAGGALAAGLHHIAETGAEVQYQLASLNALSGETAPVDLNRFVSISAGTLTSLKDAAEGVHALAQAGLDQEKAFAALPDVMRLATLGEMSVAQAAEMAVESMHAFGKEVSDLGQIGDILVAVGAKSNVSVHKLAEDMKSAATTGEIFGMTMEEITAAVGTLAERGLTIQPLSSAMMKLYEPSDKAAKVIKQLGIDVGDTATGKFRPFTDILKDLSAKLNDFSDKGATDTLKNMGFSSRDIKAMQAMTQHIDDYLHLMEAAEHAQGKMFDAMVVKMDTAEGGWKRLGSTVEGTLVKGFENASPVIQQVENELMRMFGSSDAQNMVAGLAAGVARLTLFLVEHAKVITAVAVGYGALKIIASITAMTGEYVVAQAAASAATNAQRVAVAGLAEQEAVATVTTGTLATETTVLEARMALASASAKLFASSFGWIALAATAAITVYELFSGQLNAVEAQRQRDINTHHTVVDALDQEIDRVDKLTESMGKMGEAAQLAAGKAHMLSLREQLIEKEMVLDKERKTQDDLNKVDPEGASMRSSRLVAAKEDVDRIKAELGETEGKVERLTNSQAMYSFVKDRNAVSDALKGMQKDLDVVGKVNPKAAPDLTKEVTDLKAVVVTQENHAEVLKKVKEAQEHLNAAKLAATKPANEKDAVNAALAVDQGKIKLAQMQAQSDLANAKSENSRGELGDLQLINKQLEIKKDLTDAELAAALHQADIAKGADKAAKMQQYENKAAEARKQASIDDAAAARQKLDLLDKYDTLELQARAKTLVDKGQLEDAFLLTWEAKYGKALANLNNDIADSDNAQYRDRLLRYKAYLEEEKRVGANEARFKQGVNSFDSVYAQLQTGQDALKNANGPGTGVGSTVDNLMRSQELYLQMLPQLQAAQAKVQAMSSVMFTGKPENLKIAQEELKKIQDAMKGLRDTSVTMAEMISKALTDAFGSAGAALGGMITAATNGFVKLQEIQAAYDKSNKTPEDNAKRIKDTESTQLNAYGNMASAAAGFFDKQSKGYQTLQRVSQVFHAAELAQTMAELVPKAISAVLTQGTGDPYTAFGRMAAMAALVAGLGVAISGGGGSSSLSADRQKVQGTGTVLGSPNVQSDSIARAVKQSASNSEIEINYAAAMTASLQSIEANIGSFASQVLQLGVNGTSIADHQSFSSKGVALAGAADWGAGGAMLGMAVAGPIGAAVGAVLGAVLGHGVFGKVLSSVFGGSTSVSDTGFMLDKTSLGAVLAGGANGQSYADIKTSGGWFRGDSHSTQTTSLGADANNQFTAIIRSMSTAVTQAGKLLGATSTDISSFVVDIGKISLKGLSADEAQKQIEAAFSKMGDQMAQFAVGGLEKFQQAGEGYLATLTRVASDYAAIDGIMASMGRSFGAVGIGSVAARENLVSLAGSISNLNSQSKSFVTNFLSKAEQLAPVQKYVTDQLGSMNLGWVKTRDQFKQVVLGLDLTTAAGQQEFASLMQLQDAFAKTHAATVDLTKSEQEIADERRSLQDQYDQLTMTNAQLLAKQRAGLDSSNQALFDQIQLAKTYSDAKTNLSNAYDAESQSIQSTIDRLKSLGDSWRKFRDGLLTGSNSPLTPQQKYLEAAQQFDKTLAAAKAGDTKAQDNLETAANAFLDASRTANASGPQYTADFNKVLAAVDDAQGWASQQVDKQTQQLQAIKDSVAVLIDIKAATLSVVEAIKALAVAQGNLNNSDTNSQAISLLYQQILGRAPDTAGLQYWENALKNGASMPDITSAIQNSPENVANQETSLNKLYEQIFGRAGDAGGLQFWEQALNKGMSLDDVAAAMRNSTEYQQQMGSTVYAQSQNDVQQSSAAAANTMTSAQAQQIITELQGLRADQSQQSTDQINTNVDATMAAAQKAAEAAQAAADAQAWANRSGATLV